MENRIEEFKSDIFKLKESIDGYFQHSEQPKKEKSFNIPGVINRETQEIEEYIRISRLFNKILDKKNSICEEVKERKDFIGTKKKSEMALKVEVLREKVKMQEKVIGEMGC